MWKFASNSWSSDSGQARLRRRQEHATADDELAAIGMLIVWSSFVFVVFPKLDLAVARLFAHGHVFWLAENPWLKAVRDIARQSQPYILGTMAVIIVLHVFLPRRLRFCPPHKPLFVLLSFAAGPLLVVQTLKVAIGRVRPRQLIEFGAQLILPRCGSFRRRAAAIVPSFRRSSRGCCGAVPVDIRACGAQMDCCGDPGTMLAVRGVQPRDLWCSFPVGCHARMASDHVCHGHHLALDRSEFADDRSPRHAPDVQMIPSVWKRAPTSSFSPVCDHRGAGMAAGCRRNATVPGKPMLQTLIQRFFTFPSIRGYLFSVGHAVGRD